MPKFEVELRRAWTQSGVVTVEADSLVDAKDIAETMDADEIEWDNVELDTNRRMKAEWGRELNA